VLTVIQMNDDIVVEHMIANFDLYLMTMAMIVLFDDGNFSNVVVKQMDHVHLLVIHVFDTVMNDVAHYLLLYHLLVMFYFTKKFTNLET
jgi:hypothetical protein